MKNKGFTLVELLAVIVILGVILVIAIPSISAAILNSRKNAYVATANEFVDGVKLITLNDPTKLPTGEDPTFIPITEIKLEKGSSTKSPFGKLYNPDTSGVYISYDAINNEYIYSVCLIDESGNGINSENIINVDKSDVKIGDAFCVDMRLATTYYPNGTVVYFNPVSGEKCDAASAVSTTGTKTGCMKWYAFLDSEEGATTLNLLLDHNTNIAADGVIKWNGGLDLNLSPLNSSGKILWKLKTDTDGWTGVSSRTDSYTLNKGLANYTINYTDYKARLITATEVATIAGLTSFNEVNPGTLYGLSSSYTWLLGPNITSYYTATAAGSTVHYAYVWAVLGDSGNLYLYSGTNTANQLNVGVRPVITISKSLIK